MTTRFCPLSVRVCAAFCLSLGLVMPAAGEKHGAIRKLTVDPDAPVVKLFEGIEQGVFEVRVSARDEFHTKVFLTNKTDKPKTVALPKAAAAVHVLKQFLPQNQVGFPLDPLQPGGLQPGGQQRGGGQSISGPFGPANNNNNFPNVFADQAGFFSIPPEKTVQIQMHSVCLEHGKRSPSVRKKYVLVSLEKHTSNRALRRLLEDYDPQKTDRMVLQAAAWHLANDMSFAELKTTSKYRFGAAKNEPLFTNSQLQKARLLVESAKAKAGKKVESPGQTPPKL